ncbi:MAG: DUF4097 family beta strand repeat-containing protein [Gemmatimonadaceae bacterium]
MKRLLLVALLPAVAGAQQKVLRGHSASPTVSVRLVAAVGAVRVVGWDRDSVELTGMIPKGARVAFASGAPVELPTGMKMYIEMPDDAQPLDGSLQLRVPKGARVWVKTGSAAIEVTGVTGGLDLNVVGGSITVHGSPRELRAESMDGNVVVDGSPEWMRAKTATGDITLQGGQDVGASTISGAIRASGGEVERVKLEATSGAISFASSLSRSAHVELETHSGPIDISLPVKSSLDIDVSTITGAIDNLWSKKRPAAGSEGRGMTLATSSGMEGARIQVRSFKGTVQLRPR